MEFQLIYDGKALENNEIEPKDLTDALLGIDKMLNQANDILNDSRASVKVKVKASFETGSFKINFKVHQYLTDKLETAINLFNSEEMTAVLNAKEIIGIVFLGVVSLVGLLKHLKGKRAEKIFENEDGTFSVYNMSNEEMIISQKIMKLYKDYVFRKAFERVVTPLNQDGIDKMILTTTEIRECKQDFCVIEKEEFIYIKTIPTEEERIDETIFETTVTIIRLSFEENNKWYVNDGEASFYVTIEDKEFLHQIELNKVAFSKGDLLKVLLKREQYYSIDQKKLISKHFIVKVINHKKPPEQLSWQC